MYTSELARHQHRIVFLRYNLDLSRVFGVVNTPVHHHAKPNKYIWSTLINRGTCGKCRIEFAEYPALSRADNETEICRECGTEEAVEAYIKSTSSYD